MTETNIIELISGVVAVGALLLAIWTNNKAAKRGDIESLQEVINCLQEENRRLTEKVLRLEILVDERDKRISMLESNLRDAVQGRVERTQYTRQLEQQIEELQTRQTKHSKPSIPTP